MIVEPSTEIAYRHDFPLLCNARGYKDAVEVGTDQGVFACAFLSRFEGNWLWCIDPYESDPEFPHDRTGDLFAAVQSLTAYHGRFRIVRARSIDAIPWVCSLISPEFVYIDGRHDEASAQADIRAWWDVLPPNGMLAGHDYDPGHPGVVAAVESFAQERALVVRVTRETDSPPSWYIYKTEPEKLMHRFFHSAETDNPHRPGSPPPRTDRRKGP